MNTFTATVCESSVAELGESPNWDVAHGELTWVDILAGRLYRGRVASNGVELIGTLDADCHLGAAVPAINGGWVLAAGNGFALLQEDGSMATLGQPEAGTPVPTRMNDGACDRQGRFWAGSMAYDNSPGAGCLYRLDRDFSIHRMITGTTISNGIAWSGDDRTMWFVDSGERTIDAFDYELGTGRISGRRTIVRIDPADGVPDGLAVDEDDCLWVALWDGSEVRRYDRSGKLLASVRVRVSRPTSCCFGGGDLSTLFITTACTGLSEQQLEGEPDAGRLFRTAPGVRGVPTACFEGNAEG
jgi:sugar lactone lactonase YvrE